GESLSESAARVRSAIARDALAPAAFRAALAGVASGERDRWLDLVLGIDGVPDDGPELPRGCVPYLPCPVDSVVRAIDAAERRRDDVFIDVGSGLGRAAALACLMTGAEAIGLEIQPHLVRAAREIASRAGLARVSFAEGDAARDAALLGLGSVFFFYCPF